MAEHFLKQILCRHLEISTSNGNCNILIRMKADLQVHLLPNWEDISHENPEGPPTFVLSDENATGVLQMSIQSVYESGPEPNPTDNDLIRLSEHIAGIQEAEVVKRYSGECDLGRFGCVIARSVELPTVQIWTLANGRDFVLATFLCTENPSAEEATQAETIVKTARLVFNS